MDVWVRKLQNSWNLNQQWQSQKSSHVLVSNQLFVVAEASNCQGTLWYSGT